MDERTQFCLSSRMIITDNGAVLMGLETDHWETPGGSIRMGESAIEALVREAREELGTEVQVRDCLPFFFPFEGTVNWQLIYFICDIEGDLDLNAATDNEFVDVQYMGKTDFRKLSESGMIVPHDGRSVPLIMEKLGIW